MSESAGEKTEQATPRKLEDAQKQGQTARSVEVQTVFVLLAVVCALSFTGRETWRMMCAATAGVLGHLHDTPISLNAMQGYAWRSTLVFLQCVPQPPEVGRSHFQDRGLRWAIHVLLRQMSHSPCIGNK